MGDIRVLYCVCILFLGKINIYLYIIINELKLNNSQLIDKFLVCGFKHASFYKKCCFWNRFAVFYVIPNFWSVKHQKHIQTRTWTITWAPFGGSVLDCPPREWEIIGSNTGRIVSVHYCRSPSLLVRHAQLVIRGMTGTPPFSG